MTEEEGRVLLEAAVKRAGGQRAYARKVGLSAAYISDAVRGNRALGPTLLKALGLRKWVTRTVEYFPERPNR